MATLHPYLTFHGNCRAAFNFYEKAFAIPISYLGTFGEMPSQDGFELSDEDRQKVTHVTLAVSAETVLMGSDVIGKDAEKLVMGNNVAVSIIANSKEEADCLLHNYPKVEILQCR